MQALNEEFEKISPLYSIGEALPPVLLLHGSKDPLISVSQSQTLYNHLKSKGFEVEYLELPWASHGFEAAHWGISGQFVWPAVKRFLSKNAASKAN